MIKELKKYSNLANKILSRETKYSRDKILISEIFNLSRDLSDKVLLRLAVIDGFYSTQMNKRFFGIDELSDSITKLSCDDNIIKKYALDYLHNTNTENDISLLLKSNYGFNKSGMEYGKASSLISKYLYFITDHGFPIYDSLVKRSYKQFQIKYKGFKLPNLPHECNNQYFASIARLNEISGINDYDLLDNLLWLYGKITEGSFSLIIPKDSYLSLVRRIHFNDKSDSEEIDEFIRNYIKDESNKDSLISLLGKDEMQFISFCFNNNAI
jgi:hypothetical protein